MGIIFKVNDLQTGETLWPKEDLYSFPFSGRILESEGGVLDYFWGLVLNSTLNFWNLIRYLITTLPNKYRTVPVARFQIHSFSLLDYIGFLFSFFPLFSFWYVDTSAYFSSANLGGILRHRSNCHLSCCSGSRYWWISMIWGWLLGQVLRMNDAPTNTTTTMNTSFSILKVGT